jgi:AcrR family transcriptional regulator
MITGMDESAAPTRERILDAAIDLFGRKGYSATSVGEIEEAAGLVPRSGGLYKHFPSKRALLDAAVQRRAQVAERAGEIVTSLLRGDIRSELRGYGGGSLQIIRDDQSLLRIIMREGDGAPELRDEFNDRIVRRGHASTVDWLRLAAERTGATDADIDGLATLILGWIINHCVLDTLFGESPVCMSDERFLDLWTDSTLKLLEANGLVDDPKEGSR